MLNLLQRLPAAQVASDEEAMLLLEAERLEGFGLGYIDVHLLSAARLSDAAIWTLDKTLKKFASRLHLAAIL